MTKKPGESKAPRTGMSARERVKDRQATAAGAQVVEKRIRSAIDDRTRFVIGDAAVRYASRHPSVRSLIATTLTETAQEDVRRRLAGLIQTEPPLEDATFNDAWDQWQRLRALNQEVDRAWADLELLLANATEAADELYDTAFALIGALITEWEEMMGIVHPVGRLMRMTSSAYS